MPLPAESSHTNKYLFLPIYASILIAFARKGLTSSGVSFSAVLISPEPPCPCFPSIAPFLCFGFLAIVLFLLCFFSFKVFNSLHEQFLFFLVGRNNLILGRLCIYHKECKNDVYL